jgi:hypothetical protein
MNGWEAARYDNCELLFLCKCKCIMRDGVWLDEFSEEKKLIFSHPTII